MLTEQHVRDLLSNINDPYAGRDLVSLGWVRGIGIDGARVSVDLRAGYPVNGFRDALAAEIASALGADAAVEKAVINQELCIKCGRCHVVCEDTSHQAITHTVNGERRFEVIDEECVGCNLCVSVCPVEECITMRRLTDGFDPRTGQPISNEKGDWTTHPNNPMRKSS